MAIGKGYVPGGGETNPTRLAEAIRQIHQNAIGGPNSTTNNAVALWDGATGALKDSSVIVDSTSNVSGIASLAVSSTLNLSASTAGQIVFPATQNPSTNANTLDDYEELPWTPIDGSGAGLTFAAASGIYVKIGRLVMATFGLTYPVTADGTVARIGGFPFAFDSAAGGDGAFSASFGYSDLNTTGVWSYTTSGGTDIRISDQMNLSIKTNAQVSGKTFRATIVYRTTA